jgi:hypothetical protein
MATERQIQANRANAKRSTGPVTEKGKQASSQNALRHGQLSSSVVLKAESPTLFDQLLSSLIEEFQPGTANETALVETMAVARWRLMRNWTIQTALLEVEMVNQDPEAGNPPILAALAFKSLADSSCSLQLLQRYETSLDRQYSRALNNLLKSRAAARTAVPQAQDPCPPGPQPEPVGVTPEAAAPVEPIRKFPNEPNLRPEPTASAASKPTPAPESGVKTLPKSGGGLLLHPLAAIKGRR